ncbi:MAG: cytidine deaminase [Myxococcales bacterium]|nr:cytidine deaminase [Myxococcales bacterium]
MKGPVKPRTPARKAAPKKRAPARDAVDWGALAAAARRTRRRAHAPYSGYAVGAAIGTRDGRIFAGCNVENASYGLTVCAERSAILHMVAAGARAPVALVLVAPGAKPVMPCGACRQTLAEFAPDTLPIRAFAARSGTSRAVTLGELLPHGFRAVALAHVD